MLISIIHRVNRAQGLNLDPLSSLGADKDAGGSGEGRFWGGDLNGAAGQWRVEESHTPSLGFLGSLNCNGKPVGLDREGFEKAESSAKEIVSRREGKPTCAEWRLCAGLGTQAVGGSAVQQPGLHPSLSL